MEKRRILIFNPPGKLYQRGEDRCQADIEGSAATSLRAPNDLGYIAAITRRLGLDPVIRDYPAERLSEKDFRFDILNYRPSAIVMSVTAGTFMDDLKFFRTAKSLDGDILTIAKGAIFFSSPPEALDKALDGNSCMDVAICQESEAVIPAIIGPSCSYESFAKIRGIMYFDRTAKKFKKNEPSAFIEDLDALPFPARDIMRNDLYVRPDTGRPMATIITSRGCPESCIYCLSPVISGNRMRVRSPKNIVDEVEECIRRYDITDFFFMADTFTMNKPWVIEICREILKRGLKIEWVANSRVRPLDEEILVWMKSSGLWLVSLGIESGSDESLSRMKKGVLTEDALEAVRLCRKVGLKIYAYYMIGFPWEDHRHILETLDLASAIDADFSEIHIAAPFQGTELFASLSEYGLKLDEPYGYNYFSNPPLGTKYLTRDELIRYRKKGMRRNYLNPAYIFRTLSSIRTPREFINYIRYASRLLKNLS
jgi:radical SAM superfamily enzyme YgiQ (UPF0313 family)